MSWLKKVGKVALTVGKGLAPMVPGGALAVGVLDSLTPDKASPQGSQAPQSSELAQVAQLAVIAEVMGQAKGLSGADKLEMAAPLVGPIVRQLAVLRGLEIEDKELFAKGCVQLLAGTADILNSVSDKGVPD